MHTWRKRRGALFALFAFALASGRNARAAEPPATGGASAMESARLVWVRGERTESCDDAAAIERAVTTRLGRAVFSPEAPRTIEGVLQHEGDRWEAHLYMRNASGDLVGSRILADDAPDCSAIDDAVALAIAIAIDPVAAMRAPPPSHGGAAAAGARELGIPNEGTAPPPLPALLPAPAPEVPATPAANRGPRHEAATLSVHALLAGWLLPSAAAGLALSADIPIRPRVFATASFSYWPETRTEDRRFGFGLTAGALGLCGAIHPLSRIDIDLCGKVWLGALHSVVYVSSPVGPGDDVWSAVSLALRMRVRVVGPLFAELGAEGVVPFTRERYEFVAREQPSLAFQEGQVADIGFFGVGMSLP